MEGDYKHNIIKKFCLKLTQPFKFNNELTNDPGSQIKLIYTDYLQGDNLNSFLLHLQTVKKLFPLYPLSVTTNLLVQTVYQQEY